MELLYRAWWIVATYFSMAFISVIKCDIEICEKGKPADVVFLLDASNSIWNPDFIQQLEFLQQVVDYFPIGEENIKVGVATFSDDVFPQFPLSQYKSKAGLKLGLADIFQDMGSYTRTYEAIKYMREEFFLPVNGARESVFHIGIVITDGRSYDTEKTIAEAKLAKDEGIHMFSIGVGDKADMEELRAIASWPSNHYTFHVDSYRGLQRIINMLAIKACTVTDPPPTTTTTEAPSTTTITTTTTTTTPTTTTTEPTTQRTFPSLRFETRPPEVAVLVTTPSNHHYEAFGRGTAVYSGKDIGDPSGGSPDERFDPNNPINSHLKTGNRKIFTANGCVPKQPMDLTFVIDSKQGGTGSKSKIWKFVKNVVSKLDMNNGDIKVRFIHDCLKVPGIHLNQYKNHRNKLLDALEILNIETKSSGDLLKNLTNQLAEPEDNFNTILERRKVGVFITDGASGELENTLREAQNAKLGHGIELYGIGITEEINDVEMQALVSCPVEKHLHLVPNHGKLRGIHKMLARQLCQGVSM